MQGFFHGADDSEEDAIEDAQIHLRAVLLGPASNLAGQPLAQAPLGSARVTAVVRQGVRIADPAPDLLLQPGDTLVLAGTLEQIGEAEARLTGH